MGSVERALLMLIAVISTSTGVSDAYVLETVALTQNDFAHAQDLSKDELWNKHAMRVEDVNGHRPDIRSRSRRRLRRNGVSRVTKLWPHGTIPYAISPHYTSRERALLARAIQQYHDKTCIRFVPRQPGEPDYLFIGKVDGCFSEVGRTSGVQVLSLDNGCLEYATIIHEMMHVVGFYHEHERWDRDNYIDIIWQNIDKGALDQFGKVDLGKTSYYGQSYDYRSILHYDSLAFSKNGFPTMLPKQQGYASTIGNAKDFSDIDLAKINRMYSCVNKAKDSLDLVKAQGSPLYSLSSSRYERPYFNNEFLVDFNDKPTHEECKDQITVCWWSQKRCKDPSMKNMMNTLCPRTCNLC